MARLSYVDYDNITSPLHGRRAAHRDRRPDGGRPDPGSGRPLARSPPLTGAPAWLKPAKFAVSTAIYTLTLAWIFTYLPEWIRTRRIVGRGSAAILIFEVGAIYLQAWRGTTSHFNVATTVDAALFTTMGLAIVIQTVGAAVVAVALWRQPFADAARGWALRLGLTVSIVGASTGGLMTTPRASQIAEARATHHMAVSGSHTVGAPDGGPGLPGTGWSRATRRHPRRAFRRPPRHPSAAGGGLVTDAPAPVRRAGLAPDVCRCRKLFRVVRAAVGAGTERGIRGRAVAGVRHGVCSMGAHNWNRCGGRDASSGGHVFRRWWLIA